MTHDLTDLLLLRHGESTWNAVRRWQGQADPPLTPYGEAQAKQAAEPLAALGPFDVVVTSTLQRAHRTGRLLAASASIEFGDPHPGLVERSAGPWEGLTRFEIEEHYPGFLDDGRRPDGYEDDGSVVERAVAALLELARARNGSTVVVVSHGGVINALERNVGEAWKRLDNLEGRWFQSDGSDVVPVGERVRLLGWDSPSVGVDRHYA